MRDETVHDKAHKTPHALGVAMQPESDYRVAWPALSGTSNVSVTPLRHSATAEMTSVVPHAVTPTHRAYSSCHAHARRATCGHTESHMHAWPALKVQQ